MIESDTAPHHTRPFVNNFFNSSTARVCMHTRTLKAEASRTAGGLGAAQGRKGDIPLQSAQILRKELSLAARLGAGYGEGAECRLAPKTKNTPGFGSTSSVFTQPEMSLSISFM